MKKFMSTLLALAMTITVLPLSSVSSFADQVSKKSSKAASRPQTLAATATTYKYEKVSKIDSTSDNYLIVYGSNSVALNNKGDSNSNDTSVSITNRSDGFYDITNVDNSVLWNFSKTVSSSASDVKISNMSGKKLCVNNGSVSMNIEGDDLVVAKNGEYFNIYYDYSYLNSKSNYLQYKNNMFLGKQIKSDGSSESTYKMTIYKQIPITVNYTYTFTQPTKTSYKVGQSIDLTGGKITKSGDDGTKQDISLTEDGVEVTGFDSSSVGEKTVTVKYENQTFIFKVEVKDSTITAIDPTIPDDAEYPNQGSVRVSKDVTDDTKSSFDSTGLARIELGVTGVPSKKGVDAVLVFDRSYSMNTKVSGTNKTRAQVAKEASIKFIEKVLEDNADGSSSNNRIAIVTFNDDATTLVALSDDKTTLKNAINSLSNTVRRGNTNYDAGVKSAYNILNTAKSQSGYNREQSVLFLSDGAPQNGYNDYGVGMSDRTYNNLVNAGVATTHKYSTNVKNLPATMYTVGFGLADYSGFSKAQTEQILRDWMASSSDTFYSVQSASELDDAFVNIGTAIKKAGTNASVTDKMGSSFNLQMGQQYPSGVTAATFPTDFDTTIKVLSYKLDDQGKRTNQFTTKETVTFSKDGKIAKSDKKTDANIIVDNKIVAKNFTYDLSTEIFTWTIGDITEEEIVLSYPVYLTGSMEGTRDAGNYDTNESAKLNYTNINNKPWEKEFAKPSLPWKSANVKVEYYLVNKEGQPINSAGTVVPYEYRKTISSETKGLTKGQNVDIKASDNTPNGYTLHNNDAFYKITGVGQAGAVRTYSDNDKSTKVSNTDTPYTTSSVAFGVMTSTDLKSDSIVLDYGKPITFNVLSNDGLKNIKLNGIAKQEGTSIGTELNTGVSKNHNDAFLETANEEFGSAKVKNNTGDVTYTLSKYMSGIDKFYYEATGTTTNSEGQEDDFYKYSSISVIPATSVYYEDNFGSDNPDGTNGIIFGGGWTVAEDTSYNATEKEEQDSNQGSDATYGKDSSYSNDGTFSYGSAHVVTAKDGQSATAEFKFKGTGFDLISRTDNNTGWMKVRVYNSNGKLVKNIARNTVYETEGGALYQIPVVNVNNLTYGEYRVVITISESTNSAGETTPSTVYIDGIRIYNPIDPNGEDAAEANNQYKNDKEANAIVKEIRNLLLDTDSLTSDTNATGIVFVDSKGDTPTISNYKDLGPNNEVYLSKGNSIGFKLKSSTPTSIKIGAKAPSGSTKVAIGSNVNSTKDFTLNSATDMYYDVTNAIVFDDNGEAYVVITNTGDSDAIVSLTNIKFTYDEEPLIQPSILSNIEVGEYTVKMTLDRNSIEGSDSSKDDNETEDSTDEQPNENPSNDKNNTLDKVANTIKNTIKNLFSKWFK